MVSGQTLLLGLGLAQHVARVGGAGALLLGFVAAGALFFRVLAPPMALAAFLAYVLRGSGAGRRRAGSATETRNVRLLIEMFPSDPDGTRSDEVIAKLTDLLARVLPDSPEAHKIAEMIRQLRENH
jgi:hypothetical protein